MSNFVITWVILRLHESFYDYMSNFVITWVILRLHDYEGCYDTVIKDFVIDITVVKNVIMNEECHGDYSQDYYNLDNYNQEYRNYEYYNGEYHNYEYYNYEYHNYEYYNE